jgi:hypothetical protein
MADHPHHDPYLDDRGAALGFLWVLFAFKMATVVIIFWHMRTFETFALLTATTWFWFPIAAVLVSGPLLFRYRLRRVRAKREQLRRAEWMLQQEQDERVTSRP